MSFYLYIIQSPSGKYYKGVSGHPVLRLHQHNNNEVQSTAHQGPWRFVGVIAFETKREALIQERKLNKYGREKLEAWILGQQIRRILSGCKKGISEVGFEIAIGE